MIKKDGFSDQISFVLPEKIIEMIKENPLISDLYMTDIGYYRHARYHYRERTDGSDQFILIYCTEGKGEIRINKTIYEITANSFIIIPSKNSHSYCSDLKEPWSIYWIHFTGTKADLFSRFSRQVLPIEQGKTSRINDRLNIFSDIFRNLEQGFSVETLEYSNLCLSSLLASFTYLSQYREIRNVNENDPLAQSINYMLENLNRKLYLKDVATEVGLSASYYSRLFHAKTGHSPIDYFIQLKIQRACRLLDNSGWMIVDVAREAGFDDQYYFSRVFHKVMGMSPTRYRKRQG